MNGLKALGVAVGVFVIWSIAAFFLMSSQHVGQSYDPNFGGVGAWFVDPAKADEEAVWIGNAMFVGAVVAAVAGLVFFFRKGLARFSK